MKIKLANILLWLTLGVALGLVVRGWIKPHQNPAGQVAKARHSLESLQLERAHSAETIYARLPEIAPTSVTEATRRLTAASSSKSPERSRAELHRLLLQLASDPDAIADLVKELEESASGGNNRRWILTEVFKLWAARDPQAAAKAALALNNYQLSHSALPSILKVWAKQDAAAALAFVETLDENALTRSAPSTILNALAEANPSRAYALAKSLGDPALERQVQQTVLKKKAESDFDGAWAEIAQEEDREWRQRLQSSLIDQLARKDKPAALAYTDQLEERQREYAVRGLFRDWPISDPEAAKRAFLEYPRDRLPDGVAFDFGQTMNLAGGADALAFSQSLEGEVKEDYLSGVLTEQAIKRPEATSKIAANYLSDDKNLGRVYKHLGESWAGRDEHTAAEWLTSLPESAARDQAVSGFAKKLIASDPERALQWAATIRDPKERTRRTGKLLEQWRTMDNTAAEAWTAANTAELAPEN